MEFNPVETNFNREILTLLSKIKFTVWTSLSAFGEDGGGT
jgi:hypothetical protein